MTCSSRIKKLENIINSDQLILTSDVQVTQESDVNFEHNYFFTQESLTNFCEEVVIYIAGFVAFKLAKSLKCEICISCLFGIKENLLGSFVDFKSKGGLSYPSDDVIAICVQSEKTYRTHERVHTKLSKCKIV